MSKNVEMEERQVSTIEDYLLKHPDCFNKSIPLLPLMHSCECFDARSILTSRRLEARYCNVFNKKLLYFYYGKPSYPVGEKVEEFRTDLEYSPVCFILDTRKVFIHKVYPFDSGAFKANIYNDFIHRNMKIDEFEIPNSIDGIKSYLSFMFENNKNYIDGAALKRSLTNNSHMDALINMMTANGTMKFDERGRTIEVISKEDVQIKDAVKCIILPQNLLQDTTIVNFLSDNSIDYVEYKVRQLVHPTAYYETIFEKASNYIETHREIN